MDILNIFQLMIIIVILFNLFLTSITKLSSEIKLSGLSYIKIENGTIKDTKKMKLKKK